MDLTVQPVNLTVAGFRGTSDNSSKRLLVTIDDHDEKLDETSLPKIIETFTPEIERTTNYREFIKAYPYLSVLK